MLYNNDNIYITGLTGMSGAGKTTACSIFSESGFAVIDCDHVARDVVGRGRPALAELTEHFTTGILNTDGTLDRRKLGDIVFSDSTALKTLNDMIYPFITYEIICTVRKLADSGNRLVLLDAPTLFESGADILCDTIVSVTAAHDFSVRRIMARDGISREQAENRLRSQHDAHFYESRSAYCAENSGTLPEFEDKLRVIADKIRHDALSIGGGA